MQWHPPNLGGGPPENTVKQGVSDTPPPKFRGYGLTGVGRGKQRTGWRGIKGKHGGGVGGRSGGEGGRRRNKAIRGTRGDTRKQRKGDGGKHKGGGGYMREIGTMWQIGVLTGNSCTFWFQNRSFSTFWHYKNKERLSKGLDVKWHTPSTCLDASKMWFSAGIYSTNRASEWLWLEMQETPQNGQNVHGLQVRTPICHIVPVSCAYGGGGQGKALSSP